MKELTIPELKALVKRNKSIFTEYVKVDSRSRIYLNSNYLVLNLTLMKEKYKYGESNTSQVSKLYKDYLTVISDYEDAKLDYTKIKSSMGNSSAKVSDEDYLRLMADLALYVNLLVSYGLMIPFISSSQSTDSTSWKLIDNVYKELGKVSASTDIVKLCSKLKAKQLTPNDSLTEDLVKMDGFLDNKQGMSALRSLVSLMKGLG